MYFADDNNLLNADECPEQLNKYLNVELKSLANWFTANRISLNVSKTELVIFKPKRKHSNYDLKLKLIGKRLYPTDSVKYLEVKIDSKISWKVHINDIAVKLVRANPMLYKICNCKS